METDGEHRYHPMRSLEPVRESVNNYFDCQDGQDGGTAGNNTSRCRETIPENQTNDTKSHDTNDDQVQHHDAGLGQEDGPGFLKQ
jgi:hypothetical protein